MKLREKPEVIIAWINGEGFMLYPMLNDGTYDYNYCCKLKTDYYVGKKKLMRMTDKNVKLMYKDVHHFQPLLSKHWYTAAKSVVRRFDEEVWLQYTDQERRAILETYRT